MGQNIVRRQRNIEPTRCGRPHHGDDQFFAGAFSELVDFIVKYIGGGDSAAAIAVSKLEDKITQISTGGGACLEFLEGRPFAAIELLDECGNTIVQIDPAVAVRKMDEKAKLLLDALN